MAEKSGWPVEYKGDVEAAHRRSQPQHTATRRKPLRGAFGRGLPL
jgi:hypothetical protein